MSKENGLNSEPQQKTKRRLAIALVLNTVVIAVELVGGRYANSMGLLSDALHNLIDEATLILTFYAYHLAARPASHTKTFGFHKVEALAGWVNAAALILVALWLMADMVQRLFRPQSVHGIAMLTVALGASLGNLAVAMSLRASARQNLNIRSAYLHNLGDAVISLASVVGGFLIARTGWTAIDPFIGLGIGIAVLLGTWKVLKASAAILLDHVPDGIQPARVVEALSAVPGVVNVHDLHIWAANPSLRLLTCQLLVEDMPISEGQQLQRAIRAMLFERFGIGHATIQLETASCHPQVLYCNLARRHDHRNTGAETVGSLWRPS